MQDAAPAVRARRGSTSGVTLTREQLMFCARVAKGRNVSGSTWREADSGVGSLRVNLVGAMAEVAVCLFYGLDYEKHVEVLDECPGPSADVRLGKWRVSVKGRERFESPLDLVINENDVHNHIYMLCSVDVDAGYVELRGYCTRPELLKHPLEGWKWAKDRPGAAKAGKRRRYVPVESLRPCKKPEAEAAPPAGAAPAVEAWVDGSCNNVTGVGGWGVVLLGGEEGRAEHSGGVRGTTNNRMEIVSALQALRRVPEGGTVNLYSDSAYLVNSMANGWVANWKAHGWRKGAKGRGGDVHNKDLWEVMLQTVGSRSLTVNWCKVKGHAGVTENERADELAGIEYRKLAAEVEGNPPPPISPLAEAMRTYLIGNPHNGMQPASWIMSTLWAYDMHPERPDPAKAMAAMRELEDRGLAQNGRIMKERKAS